MEPIQYTRLCEADTVCPNCQFEYPVPVKDEPWQIKSKSPVKYWLRIMLLALPWGLLTTLSVWLLVQQSENHDQSDLMFSQLYYTPVQHLIEYETRLFHVGFTGDYSEFQRPPSPELDKMWSDLYTMGIMRVPIEIAAKLPNKTSILPHDEDRQYVIQMEVFHQIHCLDMVRKALHPEYYDPKDIPMLDPTHVDHCVDAIRQSLMCSVDVTVLPTQWDEVERRQRIQETVPHTCRNFDKIRSWARDHAVLKEDVNRPPYDYYFRELNDPLDPDTWTDGYYGE